LAATGITLSEEPCTARRPAEASLIEGLDAWSFPSLLALVDRLTSYARLAPFQRGVSLGDPDALPPYAADLAEVKGLNYSIKS
jgi:hypothetical protein